MSLVSFQEIFNEAVAGLASQDFQRAYVAEGCRYRGPDGTKCAIGHLIPDEFYKPEFEGLTATGLPDEVLLACGFEADRGPEGRFMNRLQSCHDQGYDPPTMRDKLRDFAEEYELEVPDVLAE